MSKQNFGGRLFDVLFYISILVVLIWVGAKFAPSLTRTGSGAVKDAKDTRSAADTRYFMGVGYAKGDFGPDAAVARSSLIDAGHQGDAEMQRRVAVCFEEGLGVMPKDEAEAVSWFTRSAEGGDAVAQYNLGLRFYRGAGVPRDYVKAAYWLQKSAEQGNALAQYNLGCFCYAEGCGVPKDEIEAYAWLNLAGASIEYAREIRTRLDRQMSAEARLKAQQRSSELLKEIESRQAAR